MALIKCKTTKCGKLLISSASYKVLGDCVDAKHRFTSEAVAALLPSKAITRMTLSPDRILVRFVCPVKKTVAGIRSEISILMHPIQEKYGLVLPEAKATAKAKPSKVKAKAKAKTKAPAQAAKAAV
jgi:hypothetical protein